MVNVLTGEGVDPRGRSSRPGSTGGNLGRARRLAPIDDGLAFRDAARPTRSSSRRADLPEGSPQPTRAGRRHRYKKGLK